MTPKKLFPLIHHELIPGRKGSVGRKRIVTFRAGKKGTKRRGVASPLKPTPTTRGFYRKVANLRDDDAAEAFLRQYPQFTVYDPTTNGGRPAKPEQIDLFGKIVRKYATGVLLRHGESDFLNEQLSGCYPSLVSSAFMDKGLNDREAADFEDRQGRLSDRYIKQRQALADWRPRSKGDWKMAGEEWKELGRKESDELGGIVDDFALPRDRKSGRNGGYFDHIVMRARSGMSACFYYFILDIQDQQRVRICPEPECGTVFVAKNGKQTHCDRPECQAARNRRNRNAFYAKHLSRKGGPIKPR